MLTLQHLAEIYLQNQEDYHRPVREFSLGHLPFAVNQNPYLMGVINLSADSWYRESVCLNPEQAHQRARILTHQGAHLIDIGAESTLAHAARHDPKSQLRQLLPLISNLKNDNILTSIETYSPETVQAVLNAGAAVINLTGCANAKQIYPLIAEHQAGLILCHVEGDHVRDVGDFNFQDDPIPKLYESFARELEIATHYGVEKIFLDPGLGFYYRNLQDGSQRVFNQMKTFLNTFRLKRLGFPICHALPHAFEYFQEEVRTAEPFFALLALLGQTHLLRTHEITKANAILNTLAQWNP